MSKIRSRKVVLLFSSALAMILAAWRGRRVNTLNIGPTTPDQVSSVVHLEKAEYHRRRAW